MPNDKPDLRLFGLTLDLKLNLVALVAFLLSIGGLVLHGVQILRGPQVVMSIGEHVVLVRHEHTARPETPYLVISARLDYVNTGAVGRDAIISRERLAIYFGNDVPYEYRWLHFENYMPDKSGAWKIVDPDQVHSFPVPGGDAATHQTTFVGISGGDTLTPNAKTIPIRWEDFLFNVRNKRPMTLRFFAVDRRGGEPYKSACTVRLTDPVLDALQKSHWATALCDANLTPSRSSRVRSGAAPATTQLAMYPPARPR